MGYIHIHFFATRLWYKNETKMIIAVWLTNCECWSLFLFCTIQNDQIILAWQIGHAKQNKTRFKQFCNFWYFLGGIHKWRHASRGEGEQYICDTKYKVVSKIAILVWQRGEGGPKKSKFAWHHLWMTPYQVVIAQWLAQRLATAEDRGQIPARERNN